MKKEYWIEHLNLAAHPEGGYYNRKFESDETFMNDDKQKRLFYTSIYFLLSDQSPSHFHRLKYDEMWYYHYGAPLEVHMLFENGSYEVIKLGLDCENGEVLQARVPKNVIFGSCVSKDKPDFDYSLVSCVVSPGFDFNDFELFTQETLLETHPKQEAVIRHLAYKNLPEI